MKRSLLEVLGAGIVLFLLAGVHLEVRYLRQADGAKSAEIARLRTLVSSAEVEEAPKIFARLRGLNDSYEQLGLRDLELTRDIRRIEARLEENTRQAAKQATEAIGTSRALSKTVESTQKLIDERTKRVTSITERLERELSEQNIRIEAFRNALHRDAVTMTSEMLNPTVQLSGDETVGSGTIIACRPREKGEGFETFVLTANHVVRNILADDPELAKEGIIVRIYTAKGEVERRCDVVARNPQFDVALVKLRGHEMVHSVAKLVPSARIRELNLWSPVFAVGCPLGNDPIPTGGFISSLESVVRGTKYWMINAPTYYGNSGGGIFDGESRELIAVFSKIYTHGSSRPVVIPHMGLAVPMTLVYPWLEKEGYAYLVPGSDTSMVAAPGK